MMLARPTPEEYPAAFEPYMAAVPEGDVLALLRAQMDDVAATYSGLGDAQAGFRYAPSKWSLKDLLQHLSDSERVFAYRALCIGRGDATPLPGFEENDYVQAAQADDRPLADLLSEWTAVRMGSLTLFRSLPDPAWANRGTANGRQITARCFPYCCVGHTAHHLAVIRERYLPALT